MELSGVTTQVHNEVILVVYHSDADFFFPEPQRFHYRKWTLCIRGFFARVNQQLKTILGKRFILN